MIYNIKYRLEILFTNKFIYKIILIRDYYKGYIKKRLKKHIRNRICLHLVYIIKNWNI